MRAALAAFLALGGFSLACGDTGLDVASGANDAGGAAHADAGHDAGGPPPDELSIEVTSPSTPLKIAPGVPVTITWTAGPSGAATAQVFADQDGDLSTTTDQLALTSRAARGTAQTFEWDTRGATLGAWQILVRVEDERGQRLEDMAPATVTLAAPKVTIANLAPNELLRHRLALLVGTTGTGVTSVHVANPPEPPREWPASGGQFKALVPLHRGANAVRLTANGVEQQLELEYLDLENPRFVRFVYILAADGEGRFDAPDTEPNDVASAKARIATAAELMQTFTAEKLNAQGLGRRTFRIPRDASGEPIVETFTSSLTLAEARAMEGIDLWRHFYTELNALPQRGDSIDVAIMSMTTWDPAQQKALAHTALGGGRLGLFGSGALHTWAASLEEMVARFSDARSIDTSAFLDDSASRGRYWANYATGVGATLHELGHCLSLPHPANGIGVMSRQFDHFNRAFMVREPESNTSSGIDPVEPSHEIGWDRSAAVRLRFHRWLEPTLVTYTSNQSPQISQTATNVTVSSGSAIRHIAYHVDGRVSGHEEFLTEPVLEFSVTKQALQMRFPSATTVRVTAIDDQGNIGEADVQL